MKSLLQPLFKAITFLLFIIIICALIGCDKDPVRWDNHYIHFYPERMDVLYVRHGNTKFHKEDNGDNYQVEYSEFEQDGIRMFRLSVTSFQHDIHYAWFDGFYNLDKYGEKDMEKEIEWKKEYRSFSATGRLLESEYYEISLTRDKFEKR
ncbi:hypothetical protein ML462_13975 [Gramella lutea]|uniref:Lipoprotein n=1 Tax=Christiangramia lutea TaxID=1607951 RepID=A0A9X1V753_9FLAO|nr:hypothetical protein [Christiangramia lutea]MCH4824279.1 hypothetical protein [Christiangramia lutea]